MKLKAFEFYENPNRDIHLFEKINECKLEDLCILVIIRSKDRLFQLVFRDLSKETFRNIIIL